jgi:gamma-glutamyltranspeptidase/glutathione hydrolase
VSSAIATPHVLASREAARAFAAGGNAIDAALAAAAMLTVVYPHQCALGGDLFAVVTLPEGRVLSVNGSGAAPARLDVEAIREQFSDMPDVGVVPVTVPGLVAGWQSLHALGARLDLPTLLAGAIGAAADGVAVSRSLEEGIRRREAVMRRDSGLSAIFFVNGRPLARGDMLFQPELAATLRTLARRGLQEFYTGTVARDLVGFLRSRGSALMRHDFARHATRVEAALSLQLPGLELCTSPPNSQGFVLLEAVRALEALGVPLHGAIAGSRSLLRALLVAIEDRERYLGDPDKQPVPLDELFDAQRLRARFEQQETPPAAARDVPAHGDTVAVCALDDSGMAVSLIQSVFQLFGCGILDPASGIIFHNRGRGFTLRRGAPNELQAGTRPAHTLTPLIVRSDGKVRAVLGCMGGRAQPQILAQLLPAVLEPARSLEQTLRAPRWVVGSRDIDFESPTIALEDDAPHEWTQILRAPGYEQQRIPALSELVGHAHVIRVGASGAFDAASDPRSDGEAIAC